MWLDRKINEILERTIGTGTTLAVELGLTHLTVAEFSKLKGESVKIISAETVELELNNDSSSSNSLGIIINAFRDIVRSKQMKSRKIVLSIPDRLVFNRQVRLPPITPDRIHQLVQYEFQQNIPYPIDEMAWDYHVGKGVGNYGENSVQLSAVRKDFLHPLIGAFKDSGFKVVSAESSSTVLTNLLMTDNQTANYMCVDIGAMSSTIVFVDKQHKTFVRSIPMGGVALTVEIAKDLDVIDHKEAEKMKLELATLNLPYDSEHLKKNDIIAKINATARIFMAKFSAELTRTINFHMSQNHSDTPDYVFLTGGGSLLDGLPVFLSAKLLRPVNILNASEILKATKLSEIRGVIVTGSTQKGSKKDEVVINLINKRNGKVKKVKSRRKPREVCDICPFRK